MYPEPLQPKPETLANYTVEWLALTEEIGAERFSMALIQAVRDSEYFPVISKIRQYAGAQTKQQNAAGAAAAWVWLQSYLNKWPFYEYSDGIRQSRGAPAVPPRIMHAARMVGGLMRIQELSVDSLPFVLRDFSAAWETYSQTAAAITELQLEAPLTPKQLAGGPANGTETSVTALLKKFTEGKAMNEPKQQPRAELMRRGPMSDIERDQQIAEVKRRFGGA